MKKNWLISGVLATSMLFSSVAPVFAVEGSSDAEGEESNSTVSALALPSEDSSLEVWYNFDESSIELDDDGNYVIHNAAPDSTVDDAVLKNGAEAFGSFESGLDGKGILHLSGGNGNTESPYLKMPNDMVKGITGDYTISMMVKTDSDCPLGSWIMSISQNTNAQPFFFIAPNGNMVMSLYGSNRGNAGITGSTAVPINKWANVSLTYSASDNLMTAYVEGRAVKTAAVSNDYILSKVFSNNNSNFLGKSVWADPYYKGLIADFRIYSRELEASEIAEIQETAADFDAATSGIKSDAWGIVAADKNALTVDVESELYTSVTLDTKGENGSSITWSSSNESAMTIEDTADGVAAVAHPSDSNVVVTLTADISYGGLTLKKSFPITILAEKDAADIIPLDEAYISGLTIEPYNETDDEITFRVPRKAMYGSTVVWDFADDYDNEYDDVIANVNRDYSMLTVKLAANGYMPREVYLKAELSYEDSDGNTATGSVDSICVKVAPEKSLNLGGYPFMYRQINNEVLSEGTFEVTNNQLKVYGYGTDLWTAPDSCGFLYTKSTDENMSITVKLDQLEGNAGARRYGIMFRQSDDPSEKMVLLSIGTGGPGLQFAVRTAITGGARNLYQDAAIRSGYIRLEKADGLYTAYYSADGVNFRNIYEQKVGVSFAGEYLAGVVTSTNTGAGYFSQLQINGDDIFVSNDITDVETAAGDGTISVKWTDPTEQNTRTFEKIVITCVDKETSSKKVVEVSKGVEFAQVTGLENGKEYEISVQAKTAALRKGGVPSGLTTYYALSNPITLTASPASIDNLTQADVSVTGDSVNKGKNAKASVAFDASLPVCGMELKVKLPSKVSFDLDDVALSEKLEDNGATISKSGNGFKIEYNGENAPIYLSDIVSFKATSSTVGTYAIEVSGDVVCQNSNGEDKTLPINVATSGSIKIKENNTSSGSSTGTGGGAGGSDYETGDTAKPTETPIPIFDDSTDITGTSRYVDENMISNWAKTAVDVLSENGIVSGSTDATGEVFRPKHNITRAEFTKLCVSAFTQVDDDATCSFTDVNKNDWFYPYIATAEKMNIVNGRDNGSFGVNDYITRQEMSAMIYRIANNGLIDLKSNNPRETYNDHAQIADWAEEAVYKMQEAGIINGYGDGIFAPNDNATREMAAQVIYNAINGGVSGSTSGTTSNGSGFTSSQTTSISVNEDFDNLMKLMENLDIVEDGSELNGNGTIKRKDAVVYVVKTLTDAVYSPTNTAFADVKSTLAESGYINAAVDLGIIKSGAYFYPEMDMTLAEAAKMLVNAINYTLIAENSGGDPNGYLKVAYDEEIITSKINSKSETVTAEDFFEMLKNTLTIAVYDEIAGEKTDSLFLNNSNNRLVKKATIIDVDKRSNQIVVERKDGTFKLFIPENYETQEFLDITGDIWYNDDTSELIFIDISSKYEVRYDYIYGVNGVYDEDMECLAEDMESINLYSNNKRYELDDATIRYNGEIAEGLIAPTNCFVRILTESGTIKSINMYKLTKGGLITSVTTTQVSFRQGNATNMQVKDLDNVESIEAIVDGVPYSWKKMPTGSLVDYYVDEDHAMFVVSTKTGSGKVESYSSNELVLDGKKYNLDNGFGEVWYSNNEGTDYTKTPEQMFGLNVTVVLDFCGRVRYVTGLLPNTNHVLGVVVSREGDEFDLKTVSIYGNYAGKNGVKKFTLDLKKNTDITSEELAQMKNKDTMFKYYIDGNRITKIEEIEWVKCNNNRKNEISQTVNQEIIGLYGEDKIAEMRQDPYVFLTGWTFGWNTRLARLHFQAQTESGKNFELITHFDGAQFMTAYDQEGTFNPAMMGWGDFCRGWADRMFLKVGYTKDNTEKLHPDIVYILSDPKWIRSKWDVYGVVEKVVAIEDGNHMISMIEPGDVRTDYIVKGDEIYGQYDRLMPKKGDFAWINVMGYYQDIYYNAAGEEITEDEAEELEEKGEDVTTEVVYSANGYANVQKIFDLPNEIGIATSGYNFQITEVDNIYTFDGNLMLSKDEETGYYKPITNNGGEVYLKEGSGAYNMYEYEDFINCRFNQITLEDINTIKDNGFSDKLLIFSTGAAPRLILRMPQD